MGTQFDIYANVTNRIIEEMEQGRLPWEKDWICAGGIINRVSKKAYSGINILILGLAGMAYSSQQWLTFKQAKELGGSIRKGEKGTRIVFYKNRVIKDEADPDNDKTIPVLRTYTVFNIEQCEDIEAYKMESNNGESETPLYDFVQELARANEIRMTYGDPAYSESADVVRMLQLSEFRTEAGYAQAATHEFTHWTGAAKRLGRFKEFEEEFTTHREAYAREELVAELGSAFFSVYLGIPSVTTHAAYLQAWIKALRGDKKFIFSAAADANRALMLLHPAMFRAKDLEGEDE
ncbi:MAG: DUF1738 domain-containing protein [Gammaproteobacteria bacterium]|nr:DUF1738 domain-containing protein [Gammaproteobacteria bacterium]